jgi:long-subunit acyl-CoA synthetase (AMP-forming)
MNYWLGSGTNIGIIGSNNPGWIYGHIGAMMNNGFSVPISKNVDSTRWEYIINKCKLEMLLIEDSKQLHTISELNIPSVKLIVYYTPIEENLIDKFSIPVLGMTNFMTKKSKKLKDVNINNNAIIIFGKNNEGICISHKNIIQNVKNMIKFVNQYNNKKIDIGEKYLSYGSLDEYIFQIADIYLPIFTVGSVWIGDNLSLKNNIIAELKDCKPTIFIGVPKIWEKIRKTVEDQLSKRIGGDIVKYFITHNIKKEIGLDMCKLLLTTGLYTSDNIKIFYN